MSLVALITWIITAGGGLYLLSIWLIEYDNEFQASAATRLPPLVLSSHVLLAGGGLFVWAGYLVFDVDGLTWVALGALGGAAALGTVMAIRWLTVYRAGRAAARERLEAAIWALAEERYRPSAPDWIVGWDPAVERELAERSSLVNGSGAVSGAVSSFRSQVAVVNRPFDVGPPERNFPLPVVVAHGFFALVTITLVVLTALGVGGS
jgi:hypothetical protein